MNILFKHIELSLKKNFAYKVNFAMVILDEMIDALGIILLWASFYALQINLTHWTKASLIIFIGLSMISNSISNLFIGISNLPDMINKGTLDMYLVRPLHPLLLINLEYCNFLRFFVTFPIGLLLMLSQAKAGTVAYQILALLVSVLASFLLEFILMLVYLLSFWLKDSGILVNFFELFFGIKKHPLQDLNRIMFKVLTYVFPITFVATIPTDMASFQEIPSGIYFLFLCFAICLFLLHIMWKKGLARYESAN